MSQKSEPRLMIAEDDFIISLFLETVLKEAGYPVLDLLSSGESVLKAIEAQKPDCVLMDIGLSGKLNGVEVALILRQKYQVPVIFLTGNSDILFREERLVEIQPLATWIKPIDDLFMLAEMERMFTESRENAM
ncbi:response regulator [bacterium (Candidatus Blackallbacteria) CG17_big_fil_post_rev_8_21_14_2_50_48_46]|uniref:Response regulator n=1 Tax=bacterium (Candidatus Blackallbacteria) CG17_big_fil_post_rev_8_21_14_2_50_48_46 TaxID=2014261 RepID=A0A2M7FXV9_9BACT|nr:MAG: response regulator [bacterium (Candidatus Blackallbacteria) CG18_big_fil_WC_8_21_14_2_50_49_26]PIW14123.1 MAG: response regulator [bacterium (Candidatus Blackallbacteria) CG17_big_fil_post_rev_8_21_14_2_50_48_46]PIW45853.1 MAG: response regulator [bacterium (Candidatus Blackallbacteria) CG13_big_fil_rev_8_21_14_2_50_49_14]